MYRRIELIEHTKLPAKEFKHGLCGVSIHPEAMKVIDAWADIPLPKSSRHLQKNCKSNLKRIQSVNL